ncbi:MAG: transcription antitermination factor NusB [Candidatus Aminicenantes bacterium]|nr:transcription antitermination factor NusB [Candidatus Aminicenantes bacterium]NIN24246.1 transcription antitermination factor NusB [Candidatus Aminicenantes bacterium]NIN48006.1 transcription antitermination factor NusB [Candidatus Aminicenantes bacterium]NIN90909.1 transcription antitermination factor NusB [Candidatus Aminicenantes bacterium]NIQ73423.1 transcription antitermination factor NusB [Candidatus Aminicenantes bacterium]
MFRIKYCRETIMRLLYLADVMGQEDQPPEELLQHNSVFFRGLNKIEKNFIFKITKKVLKEKKMIDQLISQHLIGWKLERLMPVERSLLRMGVGESYFNDQKAIIIDDVIRIAKKYGGEDSYKIINAVLDKVIQ